MGDHRLESIASRGQQSIEVGLIEHRRLRTLLELQLLRLQDVRLHLLQVDIIVELDDVDLFGLPLHLWVERYLNVDPGNAVGLAEVDLPTPGLLQPALVNLLVPVDDVIELDTLLRWTTYGLAAHHRNDFAACMDLADSIDGTHDQLIQMPAE